MDNNTILTVIGGLAILGMIIGAIVIRFKTQPSTHDKDAAKDFLEGLSKVFYEKMIEIITNFDLKLYKSLEEAETAILVQVYDTLWDYVSGELEEASKKDILTAMALKVLNKDFVDDFVSKLIDENKISDKIENLWFEKVEKINKESEEIDEKLQEEFNDPELYNEEFDATELPQAEIVEESEDDEYTDTEAVYDSENDNSVELVEDDEYFYDKNGRRRSKATGRFA